MKIKNIFIKTLLILLNFFHKKNDKTFEGEYKSFNDIRNKYKIAEYSNIENYDHSLNAARNNLQLYKDCSYYL